MVGKDDETRTSADTSSDPALEATVPASGPSVATAHLDGAVEVRAGEHIGRYRVLEVLGRGGMGVVYRARDPELDRELAIKVVQPGTASQRAQERLLAEARAMAKLRHPAVVPVFDVGATSGGVFIVMPLISGGTMYEWMREKHSWREVVERFVTAGRGLAAAHTAGLVHRDFKPRNVLMGAGGEVLVADFGIAARTDDSLDPVAGTTSPGSAQASSIAGTPAYMAPEQAEGGAIDARADQYSFCISFWEALCGERPTDAETRTQAAMRVTAPSTVGAKKGVPSWLLQALARGFAASPTERWPSMQDLLAHIERRVRRPRRMAAVALFLGLSLAVTAALVLARGGSVDPCPDPRARMSSAWSPALRKQIEAAFANSGLPYASDTLARIIPALDTYASQWRTASIASCKAARIDRTQSEVLFARRRHCLERRLASLAGRTDAFRRADRTVVQFAVDSVEGLPSISECDDAERLLAYPEEATPSMQGRIAELDVRLDGIEAMEARGRIHESVDAAANIVEITRGLDYPPLHARALYLYAAGLVATDRPVEIVARELAQVAAEARDDTLAADAWIDLIHDLSERQNKLAEAAALEPVAEAAVVRAGSPDRLTYRFESVRASRAMAASDFETARAHAQRAVDIAGTTTRRAEANYNLANALMAMGKYRDALDAAEVGLRQTEEGRGSFHPDTAERLVLVAQLLGRTGGNERQEALLARAIDIQRRSLGPESKTLARTLIVLGNLKRLRGAGDESEVLLREAVAVMERVNDKQALASAVASLADTLSKTKGFDEARPFYLRSMSLLEETGGKEQLLYIMAESNLANRHVEAGDCATARPYYEHAKGFLESKKHPGVAMAMGMLAQCDLMDGKPDQAIATWEKALTLCQANGCQPGAIPEFQFALGGQLVDSKRDRARGIKLVREAHAGFEKMGAAPKLKNVDEWLAKRKIAPK